MELVVTRKISVNNFVLKALDIFESQHPDFEGKSTFRLFKTKYNAITINYFRVAHTRVITADLA